MLCYVFITGILRVKVNLLSAELYDTVTAERSSASTPNKTVICPSIYRVNTPAVFMFRYHGWAGPESQPKNNKFIDFMINIFHSFRR